MQHLPYTSEPKLSGERFRVIYRLHEDKSKALELARDITLEQTVEFPEELLSPGVIKNEIVGKVESLEKIDNGVYLVEISYAVETAGSELTQFLNVIFGNISLKPGIRLEKIILSKSLSKLFPGPRFGVSGLRKILQIFNRPILCTALKPQGLSSKDLGSLAFEFAAGGIDIIKDDHGLANQSFAGFKARIKEVVRQIKRANRQTGNNAIYAANVTASFPVMLARALYARDLGAKALLVAPGLVGFEAMKNLSENTELNLPIIYHPAFQGSFVISPGSGISPYALFGQLTRLAGADASIYPNFGGRFSFSMEECRSIAQGCSEPLGRCKKIFPTPGGGMELDKVPGMLDFYSRDVIFLIGAGLFKGSGTVRENCRYFKSLLDKYSPRV